MTSEFSSPTRRRFLAASATAGAIGLAITSSAEAFDIAADQSGGGGAVAGPAIRPFRYMAEEEALRDLRRRIQATRWPTRELVSDDTQGVQLATMQSLARYWANDYDWRKFETKLNALPQFITEIDGLDIHFIHVRSKHPNAFPVVISHGWPGSIVEMIKILEPLTDPTKHGGTAADAFHVVVPSMPGYGFSEVPGEVGWTPQRMGKAWDTLMKRLGYSRYGAQGGDWGAMVIEKMALDKHPGLVGIHTNMPFAMPPEVAAALFNGAPVPSGLSADEKYAFDRLDFFFKNGLAYAQEMGKRPQTLYAIDDSPIGLAAWILDHDQKSYQMISRVFQGGAEGLTKDEILDNITLYWLTKTGVSSSRLYWENREAFFKPLGVTLPVAISAFPEELYQCPKSWAERAYPKLVHYNRLPKGGHFAAWEQPKYLSEEMRAAFSALRGA